MQKATNGKLHAHDGPCRAEHRHPSGTMGARPRTELNANVICTRRESISQFKQYSKIVIPLLTAVEMIGCGDSPTLTGPENDEAQPLTKRICQSASIALQILTADGNPDPDVEVTVMQSVSGSTPDQSWYAATDADGEAEIAIVISAQRFRKRGASGYYTITATNDTDGMIGRWTNVPFNVDGDNSRSCSPLPPAPPPPHHPAYGIGFGSNLSTSQSLIAQAKKKFPLGVWWPI